MNIVAIIQVRMGSTRLPGKVLMKLENKSVLEHIIDFLSMAQHINEIVIATTTFEEDDKIEELAKSNNVKYFRGSSTNVLERFYQCAKKFNADIIVRITADDPIIDPTLIDEIIEMSQKGKFDYVSNVLEESFPIGYSTCEAFTFDVLTKLYQKQKDSSSLEHVTFHIRENPELYKVKSITAPKGSERDKWRLTIDHEQDLQLVREIFSKLYKSGEAFEYKKLVGFLDEHPELMKINSECK